MEHQNLQAPSGIKERGDQAILTPQTIISHADDINNARPWKTENQNAKVRVFESDVPVDDCHPGIQDERIRIQLSIRQVPTSVPAAIIVKGSHNPTGFPPAAETILNEQEIQNLVAYLPQSNYLPEPHPALVKQERWIALAGGNIFCYTVII